MRRKQWPLMCPGHPQLEPFGVTGVRFCEDGAEDELAVCCPETRRLMDCTVDMVCARAARRSLGEGEREGR